MFTGLVESLGTIVEIIDKPPGKTVVIDVGPELLQGLAIGDSISINGCCLTVVQIESHGVTFEAGEETLTRTTFGTLATGSRVNLERSLAAGGRMGGHFVTGHVDAKGQILAIEPDPPWAKYWFSVPSHFALQIASKGSITVDGISLTVVDALADRFSVALIPHTLAVTTLGSKTVGDAVNLETDVLAKYIERQLGERLAWVKDKPAGT